jgi:AraC-like DNA-binding protein
MTDLSHQQRKRIFESSVARFEHGDREPMHAHAEHGQLKWPSTGLARVRTALGVFVVPPSRAVWIPAGRLHGGIYAGAVCENNLYVHKEYCDVLPEQCVVVVLSARLKQLMLAVAERVSDYGSEHGLAQDEASLAALAEEVRDAGVLPLEIGLPASSRLQPALDMLSRRPDDDGTLSEWARRLSMSPRTLGRLFQQDTGMSFGVWRKRARLLYALERLATGAEVAQVAAELGYSSDSAFIYMFRRELGTTPRRYYDETG